MTAEIYPGKEYEPFTVEVTADQIRRFAEAIGEASDIYRDPAAAREAGYRAIPAPVTFPFALVMFAGQAFRIVEDSGVEKARSIHGEQSFVYHRDLCAGDTITGRQKVTDIFEKKGGALRFILAETRMENQDGEHVCDLKSTIVLRLAD